MASARAVIEDLLQKADVQIGGDRPGDITIHDERAYSRVLAQGSLGLGESYMDGWWNTSSIDVLIDKVMSARLNEKFRLALPEVWAYLKARVMNLQSRARATEVAEAHYDLGNDLYEAMLDKHMVYTCAYWKDATTLDEAQEAKLDLVCRKLGLKAGDRVLDIGCGWGSFAKFAAEKYGVSVVGITVSKEQLALAEERCKGLPVEIRFQDYRTMDEKFDHIVSIEMIEAVGYKNFREYFEVAHRCLKEGGLFLLQAIGGPTTGFAGDPWIEKYIFPNGMLPSLSQLGRAIEGLFVIEDLHNIGVDYDKTLMAWFHNFDAAWPKLKEKYDERFYRMWKYYLLLCAGLFRSSSLGDWQLVFSPHGVRGGYESVR